MAPDPWTGGEASMGVPWHMNGPMQRTDGGLSPWTHPGLGPGTGGSEESGLPSETLMMTAGPQSR